MKKSSKIAAMALSLSMMVGLAACTGGTTDGTAGTPAPNPSTPAGTESAAPSTPASTSGDTAEIYMITDKGDINDKSFNQGTWEGIQAYADANGKTCKYLKPAAATDDDYIASIEDAVKGGAKVVVTPGFLFEVPIYTVQEQYPDVSFILIDGNPHDASYEDYKTAANTVGITFAEEQVGYMAGYAAVKDGNTSLGFLGGQAVPAVVRYGYGFVQGADAAATELGIQVDMKYFYTGGFDATPEAQTMAASWYQSGTQVIFSCGGSVGNSAMAAAATNNGKVIGVDVDQSSESDTVITSAMKGLATSVQQVLDAYYTGNFPGGQNLNLGAAEDALGLPMETSKWETFAQADYDALFAKLADGSIAPKNDAATPESTDPTGLGCTAVTINFIVQ